MPDYRAHILRPDGHFHYWVDLDCQHDAGQMSRETAGQVIGTSIFFALFGSDG